MDGLVPTGLQLPPGVDPMEFYLQIPAMAPTQAHAGADMTMTTNGPDQVWYLVVAITCTVVPAIFLGLRIYTRLAIERRLELADCKYKLEVLQMRSMANDLRLSVLIICTF
jgi:hypothetical protein